ncbi:MAG TPA: hypothetical protein ENF57_04585 [Candidatus Korarchaeota archaeon]|nr:hypothetical protein [Candidatus Korarchaeota archaeon]
MELMITSSTVKGALMRDLIEGWLAKGRRVAILMFEVSTAKVLNDVVGGRDDVLIVNSIAGNERKSLMMFATLLGRVNSGIVDEIYGAYLVSVSSTPRGEAFRVQREFIFLISLIRYLESLNSAEVKAYTSIGEPENWFSGLFDKVVRVPGGSDV